MTSRANIIQSAVLRINGNLHRPIPSIFFYPGLSSPTPIVPNHVFSKCDEILKSRFHEIENEYTSMLDHKVLENDYNDSTEHKLHQGNWEWTSYVSKGKRQSKFATIFPKTTEILESIPGFMTGTPFSYAFFSSLDAGSSIEAHSGPCNLRIRCHLPLIVPESDSISSDYAKDCGIFNKENQCYMDIGNHSIIWKKGEPVYFDDCYLHRVINNSKSKRVVLLFDLWHPDLIKEEIEEVQGMFAANSLQ